ncbi:MAG: hypothetical protein HYW37_00965 [Candidatus Colwellbacteria bacterium]|nr:hypothetical protein [Candidatus Colwellbacteria bacterium]
MNNTKPDMESKGKQGEYTLSNINILVFVIALVGVFIYVTGPEFQRDRAKTQALSTLSNEQHIADALKDKVLPRAGIVLPVRWGDLGVRTISAGVIDKEKFESIYASRGGLTDEAKQLLYGSDNGNLKITSENSGFILNLLWALGLGTKSSILEEGPMMDARYGGAENFASTGGWTLSRGETMDHYSGHPLIVLTRDEQDLVARVAKNIYRPCCNNSTYFPDCNHGMAMLGLLELMASQGISENEMYRVALRVNAYWFPDTYLNIARHLQSKGVGWEKADPKELLGYDFSSASGYQKILSQITVPEVRSGGSCGV